MLKATIRKPLVWQLAAVRQVIVETPEVKTFTLALPEWTPHRAGQHYDIRLAAPDGYQAQRSYSIASEPERQGEIDLTVERLADGEVSAYLHDVVAVGDQLEVRGPIGGYFVWEASENIPLLLVGGGSGVVPLMSMIRHRAAAGATNPTRLIYSSRTFDRIIYYSELERLRASQPGLEVFYTLTRSQPPGWTGFSRRIDLPLLAEVALPLGSSLRAYICGPTPFVETAANSLVKLGVPPPQVRTERFGPTGGVP
ncbi:MAG TPA: ferredoxin reductase [Anaerolineaceae bacterium]|nr:ferredoxin reductase [Anaerolineaceae bacterium]